MKHLVRALVLASLCGLCLWMRPLRGLPPSPLDAFAAEAGINPRNSGYLQVNGPCGLEFPRDHGPHPGYRTEWWYYTGNLRADSGELFGFQLTFFRRQISPAADRSRWPQPPSPWRTQQIYLAHAAVSAISSKQFLQGEVMARGVLDMAGAQQEDGSTRVFVRNWEATITGDQHRLLAAHDDFGFELQLRQEKAPVAHGTAGYSRKGTAPESASCYYSITRLSVTGMLRVGGTAHQVEGLAWMDHEYSTAPLEPHLAGWDWFSVQLADGSELMIYQLREKNGLTHPASSGTYVDPAGRAVHLDAGAFAVDVLEPWTSPHTGIRYPHRWFLKVPSLGLELILTPQLDDQEMRTTGSTDITYWEGSIAVTGSNAHGPTTGVGYVELTGYAGAPPL